MANLLVQAMKYDYPETIPVSVGMLPAAWITYGDELVRVAKEYPQFFNNRIPEDLMNVTMPERYRSGSCTDEWGCVWENIHEGMDAMVKGFPVGCEEDIYSLKIPDRRDGNLPHGFMYLRLLDLCGFEDAMMYFAEGGKAIETLIAKVLEYNCYQIDAVLDKDKEVYYFGDDLGMQHSLAIGPEAWRKYMKPCFAKLYGKIKSFNRDALIYMHTDGCIWEIMQDLKDCGVDMINPQIRANGLDNLVRVCRGKIPINLDLDRQMFPFGTRSQIFDHIGECVEALYLPEGGLGLSAEMNYEIPLDNIVAILDALEKYRYFRR